jgi:Holliday junction resolvase-like predicted endonuclease
VALKPHLETGWQCEEQALQVYLERGYQLLKRRWKTPFAEVDLFLRSPWGEWIIVEVKSLPSPEYIASRVTFKQKERLKKAFLWASERWGPGELHLAMVSPTELFVFTDIFD